MNLVWTGQFKKDYKRAKKQGKSLGDLRSVVEKWAPIPSCSVNHDSCDAEDTPANGRAK